VSELRVAAPLQMCAPAWFEEFIEPLPIIRHKAGLDHERHYKNIAIFQPYHAHGKDLLALLTACEAAGWIVNISGTSNYWPGTSFRIAIYRPEDQAQFQEYVSLTTKVEDIVVPTEEDSIE
jgi:hypothetical protein